MICFSPLGPSRLAAAGTDCDLQHLVFFLLGRIEVLHEVIVEFESGKVVFGTHVATAVPALVANPEIGDLVRSRMPICGSLFLEGSGLCRCHVLQPFGRLTRSARPDIHG